MNVLAENDGRTYASVAIDAPADFVSPFPGALFPCMIWDHDGRFTAAQRSEVADRLMQAGCRHAVCGGQSCEAWHDAVDDGGTLSTMGRPDKPLQPTAFGRG